MNTTEQTKKVNLTNEELEILNGLCNRELFKMAERRCERFIDDKAIDKYCSQIEVIRSTIQRALYNKV